MNILEKLSESTNYNQYLTIMSESMKTSSKGLIPFYAKRFSKILDIGCGSGTLSKTLSNLTTDKTTITGIDLNQNAIDICKRKYTDDSKIRFKKTSLYDLQKDNKSFDCIIFSSVLHELSSYDNVNKYSQIPIIDALDEAYILLDRGGRIIIRDGIKSVDFSTVSFQFTDYDNGKYYLEKFKTEYYDGIEYKEFDDKTFEVPFAKLKEFLYTYTWSEESWDREVQEQFGILSLNEWKYVIERAGFNIKVFSINADEYVKYLSRKIKINKQ